MCLLIFFFFVFFQYWQLEGERFPRNEIINHFGLGLLNGQMPNLDCLVERGGGDDLLAPFVKNCHEWKMQHVHRERERERESKIM
jgi:hypothetical protein